MDPHLCGNNGAKSKMHRRAERESSERLRGLTADEQPIIAGETIAAISTPAGEGAIALVRIAGVNAIEVADKLYRGKQKPSPFELPDEHFGEISAGRAP